MNALLNDPNQKIVLVSMLTLLQHIPIKHLKSHGEGLEEIVFVSLHSVKEKKNITLWFHTSEGDILQYYPNNKRQLNGCMTFIPIEEADRCGIIYRKSPQHPEKTFDATIECDDTSIATPIPIGIRPKSKPRPPKREGKYIQPFPVGSSLSQVTRGKNKGKWTVWGMEGVQNSLKRFANIPFYVVKWTYPTKVDVQKNEITESHFTLRPFTTREEAQEWASKDFIDENEVEISEWILTADQIVK